MLSVKELLTSDFSADDQDSLWHAINDYYCCSESSLTEEMTTLAEESDSASEQATEWIEQIRAQPVSTFSVSELMARFGLNSEEGIALLSLAEALLRVPDVQSAAALIQDKLESIQLEQLFTNRQESGLIENTTLWGIALSQQLLNTEHSPEGILEHLWQKTGNATVHKALVFAIKQLGQQFVFAEDIPTALLQRNDYSPDKTRFSFDMLGEAAICSEDVEHYFNAYMEAIQAAGEQNSEDTTSISIKLSALHPRFENSQFEQVQKQLLHRLFQLTVTARHLDIALTVDAEESDRLELTLLIFEQLLRSEICQGWGKLGLAVQAYSKRALPVIRWLQVLADDCDTAIPVRLVKGAYWDSEIKRAQQAGLEDYPVYTQKAATDLSYLTCSRLMLSEPCHKLIPQFATHNARTIAEICAISSDHHFEFQRLHGMGVALYEEIQRSENIPCRIYAPIGEQHLLLPYLVRRLLENGANSSFMFQLNNPDTEIQHLIRSPCEILTDNSPQRLQRPRDIYQPTRENSLGENLGSLSNWQLWNEAIHDLDREQWVAQPIIAGEIMEGENLSPVYACHQPDQVIGYRSTAPAELVKQAISTAEHFAPLWRDLEVSERADILRRFADLLEQNRKTLVGLCILEAGKTLPDALDELREAIDFCYYYANLAEEQLAPVILRSVTGEENQLSYQGRGVFICISPWNFPLAIFTGQIAAALVTGNTVLAKPASATSLIAFKAVELWYQAGLPEHSLQLIPFQGDEQSSALLTDTRINGVAFTGSSYSASAINRRLADRHGGSIIPLIAETGGINAMVVDSTALVEQVVLDIIRSAFNSAGQRCSALRVLYLQEEVAPLVEAKLIGAIQNLKIGSPTDLSTDIGPVIHKQAMDHIFEHIERCRVQKRVIFELPLSEEHYHANYVPPTLIRLHSFDELSDEVFGPVLHIIRFNKENLDRIINEINRSGYGLTLGVHSRNDHLIEKITQQAEVGNIYINRDQVGAIVASQPFGGMGLSGTGPKAGGPNYLKRFITEKTVSRNTTASGGNRELLSSE